LFKDKLIAVFPADFLRYRSTIVGRKSDKQDHLCLDAMFLIGKKAYAGVVSNLSSHRMVLHSKFSFPLECTDCFEILISLNYNRRVLIPVKIIHFMKTYNYYDAIEVEVVNPPSEYLEFTGSSGFSENSSSNIKIARSTRKRHHNEN
jgi:hypothetical protein